MLVAAVTPVAQDTGLASSTTARTARALRSLRVSNLPPGLLPSEDFFVLNCSRAAAHAALDRFMRPLDDGAAPDRYGGAC